LNITITTYESHYFCFDHFTMSDDDKQPGRYMSSGCICCYDAFDCDTIELGCRHGGTCICLRQNACVSMSAKSLGVGLTTEEGGDTDEVCKLGLVCCDAAIVKPSTCCSYAESFLCCYSVASIPCSEEYVPDAVCACCFLQCAPTVGCCKPPPDCAALDKLSKPLTSTEMDRGDDQKEDSKA